MVWYDFVNKDKCLQTPVIQSVFMQEMFLRPKYVYMRVDVKYFDRHSWPLLVMSRSYIILNECRISISVYEGVPPFSKLRLLISSFPQENFVFVLHDMFYTTKIPIHFTNLPTSYSKRKLKLKIEYLKNPPKLFSPVCVMDIDIFYNTKPEDSAHILHSIKFNGFKHNFLSFDLSKLHPQALLYDRNWENITIRFTVRDVFNGTNEYSFIRVVNHIPDYMPPENDFIFTNLRINAYEKTTIRLVFMRQMFGRPKYVYMRVDVKYFERYSLAAIGNESFIYHLERINDLCDTVLRISYWFEENRIMEYRISLSVYEGESPFSKVRFLLNLPLNLNHFLALHDMFFTTKIPISPVPNPAFNISTLHYAESSTAEIFMNYSKRKLNLKIQYLNNTPKVFSPNNVMDIDIFDNSKADDSTHLLYSLKVNGFKYNFFSFDPSKLHPQALLYDKNWKNITIRFTVRDVFNGTSEYSFVRVINHIPDYMQPENDFIFTNLRRAQLMTYIHDNFTGDRVISNPYLYPLKDKNLQKIAFGDFNIFTDNS
ncbi:hypothetical protein RF11_04879 [Thelohanellus kitauei]|uniref:Uncharacterized protein n=1 Tax=Thelohanellus kitauei TaxID=669202 RepID=A0A0C2J679_THEKT|nr:hypothetical protein RF11_04879 [Thelohanellus kitauei]